MVWGVVQFPGSCDERDALAAAGLTGEARLLWHGERDLEGVDAVVVPGGFSYGDYLRAGAIAAHRHSRNYVVTASVDHIDFLVPVRVGDLVILRSSVNRVYHSSMEVGVKVFVENYIADTAQHVASAYLTFVAIDGAGQHLKVAPVVPESQEQQRRYDDAGRRREIRRTELERRRRVAR